MAHTAAGATATSKMQMSPERAQEVIQMAKRARHSFPELKTVSDERLLYAIWRSFKRIDQTSDSDYHTMAKVFFQEFDRHLLHYEFSRAGEDDAVRQRFFAIITDLFQ